MGEKHGDAGEKHEDHAYLQAPDFSETLKECYWKPTTGIMPPEPSDPTCLPMIKVDGHYVPGDSPAAIQHKVNHLDSNHDRVILFKDE